MSTYYCQERANRRGADTRQKRRQTQDGHLHSVLSRVSSRRLDEKIGVDCSTPVIRAVASVVIVSGSPLRSAWYISTQLRNCHSHDTTQLFSHKTERPKPRKHQTAHKIDPVLFPRQTDILHHERTFCSPRFRHRDALHCLVRCRTCHQSKYSSVVRLVLSQDECVLIESFCATTQQETMFVRGMPSMPHASRLFSIRLIQKSCV